MCLGLARASVIAKTFPRCLHSQWSGMWTAVHTYRTHPQDLVRSRRITKHFLIRSNSGKKRSLLLTPQKSTQNIWHQIQLMEESSLCHVPFHHDKILRNYRTSSHYCEVNFYVVFFIKTFSQQTTLWYWWLCVKFFSQNSYKSFVTNEYVWTVQIVHSWNYTLPWTHVPQTQCNKCIDFLFNFFNDSFFSLKKEIHCSFLCMLILVGGWEKLYLIAIPSLKSLMCSLSMEANIFQETVQC